jgi:aspartyl-tRNA(Asn)/glutamyl-tRNA(Gln) amidotransferase subunit C
MAEISEEEVRRIADLAHLGLDDDEVGRMTRELGAILGYVAQLEGIDVDGVAPTAHVHVAAMPLRSDVPAPSLSRELVLAQAPRHQGDGFAVPGFVDEG